MCRGSYKVEKHCPSGPGKAKDASVLRGFFFSFAYFDPCQSWLLKLKSAYYFGVTFQPCIHLAQCEREQTRGSFGTWNHVSWFHFQCEILLFFLCVESSLHTCDSCTWIPTTHCRVTVDFSPTPGSISSAWFWLLQALFECHMCCSFGTVATVHSRADLINVLKLVSGIERCVVVVGIPSWLVCR